MGKVINAILCAFVVGVSILCSSCQTTGGEGVYGPTLPPAGTTDLKAVEKARKAGFGQQADAVPAKVFFGEQERGMTEFADGQKIKAFSDQVDGKYKLGPGDEFAFLVRGRDDVSLPRVIVSPDGWVNLPRAGHLKVAGRSLPEITQEIESILSKYYQKPSVTLVMNRYENNKVYVLGRVAKPGVVHLPGSGTLLEALSLAGGMPADTVKTFLSRCMIIRGNDTAIWVELKELLNNGNMSLNARLQNGDVIFIPQSEDQMAYVMGEVKSPGTLLLRSDMTLLDALMKMGGPTVNGNLKRVFLVRGGKEESYVQEVNVSNMVKTGDMRENYVLEDGDIVYLAPTAMGKFNYVLKQLQPSLQILSVGVNTAESFGVMQEVRKELWGQEGFVNGE
jgi:polysaccharide export outer membrane protein